MSLHKHYYNIFLLGFYSIISQIFIIRECFSTFSGNELTAGLILALWLTGSGAGHILSKKLFTYFFDKTDKLFFLNLTFFILNILILRYFYTLFNFTFGELINIFYLVLYAVFFIIPFSLLWGIHFNYFYLNIQHTENMESKIYYIESAGAATGAFFALFLGLKINSLFFIINILFILFLISLILNKQYKNPVLYISLAVIIILTLYHRQINILTDTQRFKNLNVVDIKETPYGKISVIKQEKYYSFYQNGVFLFSTADTLSPEIDVSLAVAQSCNIENVLIINNGMAGLIKNLIKFDQIKDITYIEHNKFLLNLYMRYVKDLSLKNKRVHILINDPRNIIKKFKKKFDIIILNNGDPYNLQINRYFTYEFFKDLKKILSDNGILLFKVTSSENFINKYQSLYIGSLYNTLKQVFKSILPIPGDNCIFLASNRESGLSYDPHIIKQNINKFQIKSKFFKNYFLKFNLTSFRVNDFLNSINKNSKINLDLYPICFFYNLILWTTRTSQTIKKFFFFIYKIKFYKILIVLLGLFFFLYIKILRTNKNLILLSMGVIGFTEISLEIVTILLYQIIRGSLYLNMGLVFLSFMLGLTLGSFIFKKIKLLPYKLFVLIQFIFVFIPFLLLALFIIIEKIQFNFFQDSLFFLFILSFSTLSGIQFPAAVKLFPDKIFGPGQINGIDLLSAALGAFIISLFIIPLYGLVNIVILLTIINLLAFVSILKLLKG